MTGQKGNIDNRLAEFVADLTELRREAGQPSLRKMAGASHYSHTALSSVLSGNRLPSQELTLAFVRACGGDDEAWRERWRLEHDLLQGPPPIPLTGTAPPSPRPAPQTAQTAHPARTARTALTAGVAGLAVVLVVALLPSASGPPAPAAASSGAPAATGAGAAADGSDPQEQRCHLDAVNASTVPVADPPGYGTLTLRHSRHCHAAWPLLVTTAAVPTGAMIRLRATRPSDHATSQFDYPYMIQPQVYSVFGNVLRTAPGCVTATVEITEPQTGRPLATATTPCVQPV
jgi:hypothetical protein